MKPNANILIVDDEPVVRLSHLRSLATANFDATAVGSGTEALSLLECHAYDLIFLDIRIPDIDGITLLKTVKQKWPESEVIIITGFPAIESAKEAVRLGAYHYLVKPVSPAEVVKAANEAIRHKHWALREISTRRDGNDPSETRRWRHLLPPQFAGQGGTS